MGLGGGHENAFASLAEKLEFDRRYFEEQRQIDRERAMRELKKRREALERATPPHVKIRQQRITAATHRDMDRLSAMLAAKYLDAQRTNSERRALWFKETRDFEDALSRVYSYEVGTDIRLEIDESDGWASMKKAWCILQSKHGTVVGTQEFEKLRALSKELEETDKTSKVRARYRNFAEKHSLSTLVAVLDLMGVAWVEQSWRDGTFKTFTEWEAHNAGNQGRGRRLTRLDQIIVAGLLPEEAHTAPQETEQPIETSCQG